MLRTNRGFAIYTQFKDFDGKEVRVQESSLATKRCCYIFPEVFMHLGEPLAGAHLTVSQAKRVIRALQRFIGEGK